MLSFVSGNLELKNFKSHTSRHYKYDLISMVSVWAGLKFQENQFPQIPSTSHLPPGAQVWSWDFEHSLPSPKWQPASWSTGDVRLNTSLKYDPWWSGSPKSNDALLKQPLLKTISSKNIMHLFSDALISGDRRKLCYSLTSFGKPGKQNYQNETL